MVGLLTIAYLMKLLIDYYICRELLKREREYKPPNITEEYKPPKITESSAKPMRIYSNRVIPTEQMISISAEEIQEDIARGLCKELIPYIDLQMSHNELINAEVIKASITIIPRERANEFAKT